MLKTLPGVTPSETICWFDLEGVLMERNVSFYLLGHKPFLTFKAALNGLARAVQGKVRGCGKNFVQQCIREYKRYYESGMTRAERYSFGMLIFQLQSKSHKKLLADLFKVAVKEDKYDVYLVTAANREIAHGFLRGLPEELYLPPENIFASSEGMYVDGKVKASIVERLKTRSGKKIMGFGDTKIDEMALEKSDMPYVVLSGLHTLMPCKVQKGLEIRNLYEIKSLFDMIHYDLLLSKRT
jgi:soluble P-type ATPase